jgi:hypothetical protein
MADKEEFLPLLCFSPVTTIPPTLHTHPHVHLLLPEGQKREALKPSKRNYLSEIGQYCTGSSYVSSIIWCAFGCSQNKEFRSSFTQLSLSANKSKEITQCLHRITAQQALQPVSKTPCADLQAKSTT